MALAGVREYSDELKRKRDAAKGSGKLWLKIAPGESVRVRPLEQDDDFVTAFVHGVKAHLDNGKEIFKDIVCLDQAGRNPDSCPGCVERAKVKDPQNDRTLKRRFKFWINVIWRDGPVFETEEGKREDGSTYEKIVRDSRGEPKVKGRDDVLAIWSGGIKAAEELDFANGKFGGLTNRDFEISREGSGLDTEYRVTPARDENGDEIPREPLSDSDRKKAADKPDLKADFANPPSYEDFWDTGGGDSAKADGPSASEAKRSGSPFARRSRDN